MLMQVYEHSICGPQVVRFVQHLLRHIPGKLLIIWDGARIHRCTAVKEFLVAGGSARVHLERLPPYAPELDPDEGIWCYLKQVELRNVICQDGEELHYELRLATARLHHKTHVIPRCFAQAQFSMLP